MFLTNFLELRIYEFFVKLFYLNLCTLNVNNSIYFRGKICRCRIRETIWWANLLIYFIFVFSSLKICSIPGLKMRRGNTSWRGLCNIPTHTSWMSSAPDATRSQLFSVMHKLLFCALVAPQSFVSPLVAGQGSQKVIISSKFQGFGRNFDKKCWWRIEMKKSVWKRFYVRWSVCTLCPKQILVSSKCKCDILRWLFEAY